ncbi:MAG: CRTAC1 family protein [Planctomycetales bacterium]
MTSSFESHPPHPENDGDEPVFGEAPSAGDDAVISRAFQISVMVIVLGGLIAFVGVWWWFRPLPLPPDVVRPSQAPETRDPLLTSIPSIGFTDVTRESGLTFLHESGATGEKLLPESMGGGCAFFDYNNDGHQDLLFVNSDFWPPQPANRQRPTMALYQNDGRGHFTDVTDESGLGVSFYGQGVAVGDYDNDGWVDLFFSAVGSNHLFHNVQGRFEEVTTAAGVSGADDEWSSSSAWFDCDNDGDLDLFVCNYVQWSPEIDRQLGCTLLGGVRAYCRPDAFRGSYSYLYRNDGAGRFTDISESAGIQVKNRNTGDKVGKSLGVMPIDVDGDGWMDLIVANDTVQNFLFHNRRDGTFVELGEEKGIAFDNQGLARGAMGIHAVFYRNDDTLAVAIGNFALEMTALYCARQCPIEQLQFSDDAVAVGLGPPSRVWLKFGVFFFDADLDGRLDLLVANGHIENDINKVLQGQKFAQPPQLYWNAGPDASSEFVPVPADKTGSDFTRPLVGRGAAYADIDGDGDLDVLLTSTGGAPRLLRNDQQLGHHWLRVKLAGKTCNHDALGAWVELHQGETVQRRQVMAACSYLSQMELPVTFGLGAESRIDKLVVRWPDGTTQEMNRPAADQMLTIEQSE